MLSRHSKSDAVSTFPNRINILNISFIFSFKLEYFKNNCRDPACVVGAALEGGGRMPVFSFSGNVYPASSPPP